MMKSQSKFGKKNSLTILTCLTACLGFIMLCVSVSTDNWLTTFERDSQGNGTTVIAIHSGLWRECKQSQYFPTVNKKTLWNSKMRTFPRFKPPNCTYIKYFKGKPKGLAEVKPPEAILYDMQPAAFFPTTGLLGLFSGCILSFLSYCDHKVKKLIFIGGGLFVFSGIFLLVGIVLYVGSISQTFDSTAGNLDSEDKFVYDYGESFYFSVFSFILTEFSGIFAIYLYIAKHKHYIRVKRDKKIARSQSVNSCVGLVPSASRFSFEAPPERLINSADLSSVRKKRENISASTSVEWCEVSSQNNQTSQSQWLLNNSYSKGTMVTALNSSQSREKLFRMIPNGPNKPVLISKNEPHITNIATRPMSMFYDEEIGETSFGYHPRLDFNTSDPRVFYDNNIKPYYVDSQHLFNGKQNIVISPEHSIISTVLSPRHKCQSGNGNEVHNVQPPIGHLKDIHLLTSLDGEDMLSNDRNGHQCNCAQVELVNDHVTPPFNPIVANNTTSNNTLPYKSILSTGSSRKITSV